MMVELQFSLLLAVWVGWFTLFFWTGHSLFGQHPSHLPLRHGKGTALWSMILVLLAGLVAWVYATNSRHVDFDTWSVPTRIRLEDHSRFFTAARPVQHWWTYLLMRPLLAWNDDPIAWRIVLTTIGMAMIALPLVLCRRVLFGSNNFAVPALAVGYMALLPQGEFLADCWNDHIPLIPLHILGVATLLLLPSQPQRASLLFLGVFLLHSLNHSIEPYLWVGGLGIAAFFGYHGIRKTVWKLVGICLILTVIIISLTPGGWIEALFYKQSHVARHQAEGQTYWEALNAAAIQGTPSLGPQLAGVASGWVFLGVVILGLLKWGRNYRDQVYALLLFGALIVPIIYEPENPERHLPIGITLSLIFGRSLVRMRGLLRHPQGRQSIVFMGPALMMMGSFVAGLHFLTPSLGTVADHSLYVRAGNALRSAVGKESLVIIPPGDVWHHVARQFLPSREQLVRELDDLSSHPRLLREDGTTRTIYLTGTALLKLSQFDYDTMRIRALAPSSMEMRIARWPTTERLPTRLAVADLADFSLTNARRTSQSLELEIRELSGATPQWLSFEIHPVSPDGMTTVYPRKPLLEAKLWWKGQPEGYEPVSYTLAVPDLSLNEGKLLAVINRPTAVATPDSFPADNWRPLDQTESAEQSRTPTWVTSPGYFVLSGRHILSGMIQAPEFGSLPTTATLHSARPGPDGALIPGILLMEKAIPALEPNQTGELALQWYALDPMNYLFIVQILDPAGSGLHSTTFYGMVQRSTRP
jgi:hypothetical protein